MTEKARFSRLTCAVLVAVATGVASSACPPSLSRVSCQCFSDRVYCNVQFASLPIFNAHLIDSPLAVSLLELHLSGSSRLPDRLLENVTLAGLTVTESGISLVEDAAFASLSSSLEALGLAGNRLPAVPSTPLSRLRHLQRLDLSRNRIRLLAPGDFEALTQLKYLDLSDNELSAVPDAAFRGLSRLEHLDLSSCRLHTPLSLSAATLPRLAWLSFAKCQLKGPLCGSIPDALVHLDLSHNDITDVAPGFLAPLAQLQTLDLSWNFLSNVSLEPMPGLRTLDLSHNTLERFPAASDLPSLVVLRLDSNFIEDVDDQFLAGSPMVQEIELRDNNIRHVSAAWIERLQNVHTLLLEDNLLRCDCSLSPLLAWLSESGERLTEESRASFVCEEPLYVQGTALAELDADDLGCDRDDTSEPLERYLDRMQRVVGELRRRVYEGGRFWLSWRLTDPPLPYKCDSLFVWEESDPRRDSFRHFPAECHSRRLADPTLLSVDFPASDATPHDDYHACLVLFARHRPLLVCAAGLRRDFSGGDDSKCPTDAAAERREGGGGGTALVSWRYAQRERSDAADCQVHIAVRLGDRLVHNASALCSAQAHRVLGLVAAETYDVCVKGAESECGEACVVLLASVAAPSGHRSIVATVAGVATGLFLLLLLVAVALLLVRNKRHSSPYLLSTNEEGPRYKMLLESHSVSGVSAASSC